MHPRQPVEPTMQNMLTKKEEKKKRNRRAPFFITPVEDSEGRQRVSTVCTGAFTRLLQLTFPPLFLWHQSRMGCLYQKSLCKRHVGRGPIPECCILGLLTYCRARHNVWLETSHFFLRYLWDLHGQSEVGVLTILSCPLILRSIHSDRS